jgi:hypothetical protein
MKIAASRFGFGVGLGLALSAAIGLAQAAPTQTGASSAAQAAASGPAKPVPARISHSASEFRRVTGGAVKPLESKINPNLTKEDCWALDGEVYAIGDQCLSGLACLAVDESGKYHAVCISKE